MSLWFRPIRVEELNRYGQDTMSAHMGVVFTEVGEDFLQARMPVDHRSVQYMGILHGGASAFLIENIASVAANLVVDPDHAYCVGLEINANHLRPVRAGQIRATTRPIHLGQSVQVWDVRLEDDQGHLTCIGRMTMAVRQRNAESDPAGLATGDRA